MFYDQLTPSRPYRKSATSGRNALGHKTNKLINYYVGIWMDSSSSNARCSR